MTTDGDKAVAELRRQEHNRDFDARFKEFTRNIVHLEPKPDDKPGETPERWHTLGELADRADREVHVVKDAAIAAKVRLYREPDVVAPPPEAWLVRHRSACELGERNGWGLNLKVPAELGPRREARLLTLLAAAADLMAEYDTQAAKRLRPASLAKSDGAPNMAAISAVLATRCGNAPEFGAGQIETDLGQGYKLLTPRKDKLALARKSGKVSR